MVPGLVSPVRDLGQGLNAHPGIDGLERLQGAREVARRTLPGNLAQASGKLRVAADQVQSFAESCTRPIQVPGLPLIGSDDRKDIGRGGLVDQVRMLDRPLADPARHPQRSLVIAEPGQRDGQFHIGPLLNELEGLDHPGDAFQDPAADLAVLGAERLARLTEEGGLGRGSRGHRIKKLTLDVMTLCIGCLDGPESSFEVAGIGQGSDYLLEGDETFDPARGGGKSDLAHALDSGHRGISSAEIGLRSGDDPQNHGPLRDRRDARGQLPRLQQDVQCSLAVTGGGTCPGDRGQSPSLPLRIQGQGGRGRLPRRLHRTLLVAGPSLGLGDLGEGMGARTGIRRRLGRPRRFLENLANRLLIRLRTSRAGRRPGLADLRPRISRDAQPHGEGEEDRRGGRDDP